MKQSYTLKDVIDLIRSRIRLAYSNVLVTDTDVKMIANQAGEILNTKINDSESQLYSVDSITEDDVILPLSSLNYQRGSQAVIEGNNTINLPSAFPDSNYTPVVQGVWDSNGNAIAFNKPEQITSTSFVVYCAGAGTLFYVAIR